MSTQLSKNVFNQIQDLTKKNELIEQNLLKVQKDLVSKLEVANKQFNLSKVASQEKNNIQQFIEEMIEGLITKGKITFWAYDEEVNRHFIYEI